MVTTRYIGLKPISIIAALTSNNIVLGGLNGAPRGVIIPVNGAPDVTVSFYAKRGLSYNSNASVPLDTYTVTGGNPNGSKIFGSGFYGPIANVPDKYCYDGSPSPFAVGQSIDFTNTFVLHVIRFIGIAFSAGYIYLNMDEAGGSYQEVTFADFRIYERNVALAEIAQPLLPNDYNTRYTFAGFQNGDLIASDSGPNGNDGRFYY